MYSLKEVSTCEYEVVVLTAGLCSHPSYKPGESTEHGISCRPVAEVSQVYTVFLSHMFKIKFIMNPLFCKDDMCLLYQGPQKRKPAKLTQLEIDGLKLRSEKMFEVGLYMMYLHICMGFLCFVQFTNSFSSF